MIFGSYLSLITGRTKMNYKENIQSSQINDYLPSTFAFICFASFEKRCYTLAQNICTKRIQRAYVFRNVNPPMNIHNTENLNIIKNLIKDIIDIPVNLESPVSLADNVFSVLQEIISCSIKNIVLDVSTFTHEGLLILVKSLYEKRSSFNIVKLVYNGASKYANWLSKGCKGVRNVVGFPGFFNPSYKDHMIILTGFEKERATKLIESFDPDRLSIGFGYDPTDPNHLTTMEKMKVDFEDWFENMGRAWTQFTFSCSQINSTINEIKKNTETSKNENIILVPLNTKLSTIAVALIALENKDIQIVYPIPEVYNLDYSTPNNSFTVIDLVNIWNTFNVVQGSYNHKGGKSCV